MPKIYIYNQKHCQQRFSNLTPLKCDTFSFGAMKKNQFSGIDAIVVNKFKAPIERFNTAEDLQDWSKVKADKIIKKDYKGRHTETQIQRKAILKEWTDYVLKENDAYTNTITLLIFDGITKDLKADNDTLPPILNKGILGGYFVYLGNFFTPLS